MIIISRNPLPEDAEVPFKWGDIVEVAASNVREVVVFPDNGIGEAFTLDLKELQTNSKVYPRTTRLWSELTFISNVSLIDDSTLKLLEPLRRGVCINAFHWDEGVNLFDDDTFLRYLRGDESVREQVMTHLGGRKILEQFWSEKLNDWRVFVHRNFAWNHWQMFGPFPSRVQAEIIFGAEKQKGVDAPPERIRYGVYHNTGQINTILLYEGLNLVSEFILAVGQGMPEPDRPTPS